MQASPGGGSVFQSKDEVIDLELPSAGSDDEFIGNAFVQAGEVANDGGAEPGTIPRTLELYCGRAGWSSHHKKRGSDAWFIDIDRKCVEGSFEQRPEYTDSGEIPVAEIDFE